MPRISAPVHDDDIPVYDEDSVEILPHESTFTTSELEERLRAMADETPAEILGLPPDADIDSIRVALGRAVLRYHPHHLAPEQRRLGALLCARLHGAARQLAGEG
jgi:hypothetical protein